MDLRERLLSKRRISDTGCWLWTGTGFNTGYGQTKVNGRQRTIHRVAYEVFIGPIPEGMNVCHRCDVKRCFNPEHLYAGTDKDNSADSIANGRLPVGERHYKARFTEDQIREIRTLAKGERKRGDLTRWAERYGTTTQQIWNIIHNLKWKHVTP